MDLSGKLAGALLMLSIGAVAEEPLRLETQFGETVPILGDGQARIIVYADQDGSMQTDGWTEALGSTPCPGVAVAHVAAVPELARSMVRDSFEKEQPIALDWAGRLAERLGFAAGVANVYLVDGEGQSTVRFQGRASEERVNRLKETAREVCRKSG